MLSNRGTPFPTAPRSRRLKITEIEDATFILNDTRALGSIASVPLINPPLAANLTLEAIVARPMVTDGSFAVRHMVCL